MNTETIAAISFLWKKHVQHCDEAKLVVFNVL